MDLSVHENDKDFR